MRLWSIHPKYLDTKGLLALWREALLAKKALKSRVKGYSQHPQLIRFKKQPLPVKAINSYLKEILKESKKRGFNFDTKKAGSTKKACRIPVSYGQIKFEFKHLLKKLKKRDKAQYMLLKNKKKIEPNPLFKKTPGKIEKWEKI